MVGFLFDKEFRASHLEMIKGLEHHDYNSELIIPIIENTAEERDLKGVIDKKKCLGDILGANYCLVGND